MPPKDAIQHHYLCTHSISTLLRLLLVVAVHAMPPHNLSSHCLSHLLTISVTLISLPLLLLLSLLLCLTHANFGPESLTLSMSKGAEEP